jgi:hypothetical protein
MRGTSTCLAALFAAVTAAAAFGPPAGAGAFRPPADAPPIHESLNDLPPPAPSDGAFDLAFGVSSEPESLFRLPEASAPGIEGPFSRYEERRSSRASLVPWDLGHGDDRFATNATFFPLLGGALLIAWLTLSGWRPPARKARRRRRRTSRGSARATPSTA